MHAPFIINNNFLVNPERNSITDRNTGEESRLEQRLLEVLYLLAATPGVLVSRETIISTIWNDYGGADEGLTQAISLLRKVLGDQDKKMIETIPKKGYILNAAVAPYSTVPGDHQVMPVTKTKSKLKYIIAVIAAALIAVIIYLLSSSQPNNNQPTDVLPENSSGAGDNRGADLHGDTATSKSPDIIPDSLRNRK